MAAQEIEKKDGLLAKYMILFYAYMCDIGLTISSRCFSLHWKFNRLSFSEKNLSLGLYFKTETSRFVETTDKEFSSFPEAMQEIQTLR